MLQMTSTTVPSSPEEEDMRGDARDILKQALNEKGPYAEEVRRHAFVGSCRGLDLAGVSTRLRVLEHEVAMQSEKSASYDAEIAELKDHVFTMKLSSKGYRQAGAESVHQHLQA